MSDTRSLGMSLSYRAGVLTVAGVLADGDSLAQAFLHSSDAQADEAGQMRELGRYLATEIPKHAPTRVVVRSPNPSGRLDTAGRAKYRAEGVVASVAAATCDTVFLTADQCGVRMGIKRRKGRTELARESVRDRVDDEYVDAAVAASAGLGEG